MVFFMCTFSDFNSYLLLCIYLVLGLDTCSRKQKLLNAFIALIFNEIVVVMIRFIATIQMYQQDAIAFCYYNQ